MAETRNGRKRTGRVISHVMLVVLFLICGATAVTSWAQLPTATILGIVRDNSGAVVPQASLTARNEETGQTRTATSAADGSYRFSALPVGRYAVRVEHPGFNTGIRAGLTLTVEEEAVVNFALELGTVEQTVEVTAEAPLVNTTSGSLGGLVSERTVAELPLNGRNYVDLAFLQAGVQPERSTSASGGPAQGGGSATAGQYFSSNGAPVRSNNFMLDGAILQSSGDASAATSGRTTLGVEGIREFRLVTNSFSAEYGMRMGSQMIIVSKSGTNTVHGSLFEYLRNSALDARNFFDRKTASTPRRLPAFTRNQFGASVGGPIKKDKTFVFLVYENLRERLGQTIIANTVPVSAKREPAVLPNGVVVPQIAPSIKPILALYPNPNLPNDQYTYPFSQPTDDYYGQVRADHSLSERDSLFGRYTIDSETVTSAPLMDGISSSKQSRLQYATLSETHIFSPAVLSTFRFSFSRTKIGAEGASETGPQYDFVTGLGMGQISVTGLSNIGNGTQATYSNQNVFSYSDDIYYTKGRHSLKFGTLINRFQPSLIGGTNARGQLRFSSLEFLLLGRPLSYVSVTPGSSLFKSYRYTTAGFYAQDDFRASSRLTLNLGLRYEFHSEYTERYGKSSAIRNVISDAAATLGPPFENPSLKNFSPRFGFAWDVRGDGKTALRGGFGLLYDVAAFSSALKSAVLSTPPFSSQSSVSVPANSNFVLTLPFTYPPGSEGKAVRIVDYHMQQPHMLQYNLTVERQLPFRMGLTLAYAGSRGLNLIQRREGNPTVPRILADGRKFWTGLEPLRNPNWSSISLTTASGNSWYNSFQFGLNKRIGSGLQFQSSYTWSKAIDETQGQVSSETSRQPADPSDRKTDRGVAGFDITQNWRFNAIYRLPEIVEGNSLSAKILNGWMTTGVLSLQSGYSFTPEVTTNRSRTQANLNDGPEDRPDLVAGRSNSNIVSGKSTGCTGVPAGRELGGPDLYFDPCAFSLQPAGFLGTAGRDILRGPGLANLDFSLVKNTALRFLGENGRLEFRTEVFNILNRPNFSVPGPGFPKVFAGNRDGEAPVASSARILTTEAASRQLQFALKVVF